MTEGAYAEIKNPTDGLISLCLTWVELVHVLAVVVADVGCLSWRFHHSVQNVSERRG